MTKATVENYIEVTFDGVLDAEVPDRDGWMRTAEADYDRMVEGIDSLRYSNTELAKIIGEQGQSEVWGALLDSLLEMDRAHRELVDDLDTIQGRILAAFHQAYPQEARDFVVH